jgi:hypothetical protein
MKRNALFATPLLLATAAIWAFAQTRPRIEEKAPKTQLETFLVRKGSIIVKEFHPLGTIEGTYGSSASLDALTLYEPGKAQQRRTGIRIEVKEGGSYDRNNTAFLDIEEIDSLMKGLEYMCKVATDWQGSNRDYTEMIFSTKGDFEVGFYIKDGEIQAFIKSGSIGSATTYIPPTALTKMHQFLEKGRSQLAAESSTK